MFIIPPLFRAAAPFRWLIENDPPSRHNITYGILYYAYNATRLMALAEPWRQHLEMRPGTCPKGADTPAG